MSKCNANYFTIFFFFLLPVSIPTLFCDPECDLNAECKDLSGTAGCMCKAGFDGDGITCTG